MGKRAVNSRKISAGQGRAAADANAQGQIHRGRTVRQRAEKLRDGRQERGPVLDDFQDDVFGRMESLDEDDGAADQHGEEQADGEHETVKHRQQHHKAVFPHRLEDVPTTVHVGQQDCRARAWPLSDGPSCPTYR